MAEHRSEDKHIDCLSDETLTLWVDGLLPLQDRAKAEAHCKECASCRDLFGTLCHVKGENKALVPQSLVSSARKIIREAWENHIATILLKVSNGMYSAAETTGRVLFAPWIDPGLALRSDGLNHSSHVVIETIYQGWRCVVESSRTQEGRHALKAVFTQRDSNQPIGPSLFVLYEGNEEIESQMSLQGTVVFEDLPPGSYRLTMTLPDKSQGYLDFHFIPS